MSPPYLGMHSPEPQTNSWSHRNGGWRYHSTPAPPTVPRFSIATTASLPSFLFGRLSHMGLSKTHNLPHDRWYTWCMDANSASPSHTRDVERDANPGGSVSSDMLYCLALLPKGGRCPRRASLSVYALFQVGRENRALPSAPQHVGAGNDHACSLHSNQERDGQLSRRTNRPFISAEPRISIPRGSACMSTDHISQGCFSSYQDKAPVLPVGRRDINHIRRWGARAIFYFYLLSASFIP